jgi:hypothetical protein
LHSLSLFLSSLAQIWRKLLGEGNFWLGLLIIVFVLIGKDLYLSGLQRNFDPSSAQIVQEVLSIPSLVLHSHLWSGL